MRLLKDGGFMHPQFPNKVGNFLSLLSTWAEQDGNLVAIVLVGSYANGTAKPDSDIDLVLIANDPYQLLHAIEWINQFGNVTRKQIEYYGKVTSLRAFYSNGLEVEFGITDKNWLSLPLDEDTQMVLENGFRIIYEKEEFISGLPFELN